MRKAFYLPSITIGYLTATILIFQNIGYGSGISNNTDTFEGKNEITKTAAECFKRLNNDSNFINEYSGNFADRNAQESPFTRDYFVKVAVFTDKSMSDYYGDKLMHHVKLLMAEVTRLYKHPSIGNAITIITEFIMEIDEDFTSEYHESPSVDSSWLVSKFCAWKNDKRQSINQLHGRTDFHLAILLTRKQLLNGKQNNHHVGEAHGQIHDQQKSCAIVLDSGWKSVLRITHELGHMLSLNHEYGMACSGDSQLSSVMFNFESWHQYFSQWSNCSRNQLTNYLDSGVGDCLLDKPNNVLDLSREPFFGQIYSRDEQCQSSFDRNYSDTPKIEDNGDKSCTRLQCYPKVPKSMGILILVANGTPCNLGKICLYGKCQTLPSPLVPIHGQWGQWKLVANCSMTKHGYVLKLHRECDNPVPAYGGDYCIGERFKYEPCTQNHKPFEIGSSLNMKNVLEKNIDYLTTEQHNLSKIRNETANVHNIYSKNLRHQLLNFTSSLSNRKIHNTDYCFGLKERIFGAYKDAGVNLNHDCTVDEFRKMGQINNAIIIFIDGGKKFLNRLHAVSEACERNNNNVYIDCDNKWGDLKIAFEKFRITFSELEIRINENKKSFEESKQPCCEMVRANFMQNVQALISACTD